MSEWRDQLFHILLTSQNEDEFTQAVAKETERLEFEFFAYGLCVSLHVTKPYFRLCNNYPPDWKNRYQQNHYLEHDPTVQHCLHSFQPIVWEEGFNDAEYFWEDARAHGICWGWAQSQQVGRCAKGMITLARSAEPISNSELAKKLPEMTAFNQTVQAGFQRFFLPEMTHFFDVTLSLRELEVLRWCAEGKTAVEIGMILSITERTANFHIANAIEKLNVTNKTAAVLRAYQLGLI